MKKQVRPWLLGLLIFFILSAGQFVYRNREMILDEWNTGRDIDIYEKLEDGLTSQEDKIFVQRYHLTESELNAVWNDLLCSHPEIFYVSDTYQYVTVGLHVQYVLPSYEYTGKELKQAKKLYKKELKAITNQVDSDWTDLEKALFLHDYLATHYAYDETLKLSNAYEMLTEKSGVCQAYMLTYQALLQQVGVPCTYVISKDMEHSWNLVQIDGEWYHVDLTYDDPTFDRLGKAEHNYFLVSDEKLAADHSDWTAAHPCTSTKYDAGAVWENVKSGFVPIDGAFYYLDGNHICRWNDGKPVKKLYSINSHWYLSGQKHVYWDGCYASLDTDGKVLLFNTARTVRQWDPATRKAKSLQKYKGDGNLYGMIYQPEEKAVLCQVSDSPNDPGTKELIALNKGK